MKDIQTLSRVQRERIRSENQRTFGQGENISHIRCCRNTETRVLAKLRAVEGCHTSLEGQGSAPVSRRGSVYLIAPSPEQFLSDVELGRGDRLSTIGIVGIVEECHGLGVIQRVRCITSAIHI